MSTLTLLSKISNFIEKCEIETFWKDTAQFLKRAEQMAQICGDGTLYGSKVFLTKTHNGIKVISRHYFKVDEHWEETVISNNIPKRYVPYAIAIRISPDEELDVTDELETKMANS